MGKPTTWEQYLSAAWNVDVTITPEQRDTLNRMTRECGNDEMAECVGIVATANEPSRTVRYLLGVINRRKEQQQPDAPAPAASPVKKSTAPAYVFKRCAGCLFVNKVRRDVLERNRGRVMKCGGVGCTTQWPVDDIIKAIEGHQHGV